ncbi:WD40 repeat domain-containing protein [Phyllobacterium sp. 21LDTY02-6]|uniref:WD40 repeat domain-containing protein n=1 Tax=unclassified Phyllobacterium TaxID=2638441 RepID=UPI0020207CAB|nr:MULTISPECIES: WD40 repeat domain-containing protein [unclassified Phyllobacterium]MCO4315551.1 WD40 repeat domain-containing protein [Phyllobacterium sp. 21LDTY02-6]MCX8281036.1 WD40 repeat domain-containing protein [Phyllobacterium sp. 0TCS1.6C]MCX8295902.1 WD40 repeat domain-containing protein [Phyllobacterium sp. 0TCS1.6A]
MPTIAPLDLNGHCIDARFVQNVPFFALADGSVHRLDNGHKTVEAHDGLLCAIPTADGKALLTAGEDGRVCSTGLNGTVQELASQPRKWITSLAAAPNGAIAYGSGRFVWTRLPDGTTKEIAHERSVEGIGFAPKGLRLAVARYNGVTLHWPATASPPTELEWKGAHIGVIYSPDNRFLVTSMQENALHGWRLEDNRHMRMTGYPAKVKSWSWSVKGKWLATSGAPAAIIWPFAGKDGPMGKAPLELGTRGDSMVTAVACHPVEEIVAIGYSDGMILVGRFGDQKEVVLRRPGKGAISAMGWDDIGHRLVFGTEPGDCGVVDITAA